MNSIEKCKLLDLPRISARQGSITPVEGDRDFDFEIGRVYYLYDVPGGASRGGHAHKQLQQVLVAVMGSFDVIVDDGKKKKSFSLNRGYRGLYVPSMIWREIENFSTGGICLVLASEKYDEQDYYRDYNEFLKAKEL